MDERPENIDKIEQDILIIGAGMAGLTASIEAASCGAKVTVIDKLAPVSESNFKALEQGGKANDTARSMGGGLARFPPEIIGKKLSRSGSDAGDKSEGDSTTAQGYVDQLMNRHIEKSWGRVDPDLIRTYLERVFDDCIWLRDDLGVTYVNRRVKGSGPGLVTFLSEAATARGVRILYNTKAMGLLQDDTGKIEGVRARNQNGSFYLKARGVILTTGSFNGNQEMMLKYVGPEITYNTIPTGSPTNTGDGHLMAMAAGAQLVNLSVCHIRTMDRFFGVGPSRGLQNIYPMGIYVNKDCKRFIDEGIADSDTIGNAIVFQPSSEAYLIFDEKAKKKHSDEYERYPQKAEVIQIAGTIEELAGKINVSAEKLKDLVQLFNKAVENGDILQWPVPKTKHAHKLDTPPFYGFCPVLPGLNHPLGGLKTGTDAQVIDRDGDPIPGLYAAGSIQNWCFGKPYEIVGIKSYMGSYHAGASSGLATALVFGRIAGRCAAEEVRHKDY